MYYEKQLVFVVGSYYLLDTGNREIIRKKLLLNRMYVPLIKQSIFTVRIHFFLPVSLMHLGQ